MADSTLNARMIQRHDTAANWSSKNPVLAAGEIGLDTTNLILKTGDGATAWSALKGVPTTLDAITTALNSTLAPGGTAGNINKSTAQGVALVQTLIFGA